MHLADAAANVPGLPTDARRLFALADDVLGGSARMVSTTIGLIPPWRLPSAALAVAKSGRPNIGSIVAAYAAAFGDKVAVVDSRGPVTYGELDQRANRLADALTDRGIKPGQRLAFQLPNCREALEAFVAAGKLGVAPVPVNTRFSAEELAYLVERQNVGALVVDYDTDVAGIDDTTVIVLRRGEPYEGALAAAKPGVPVRLHGGGEDASRVVIHTSGTTGRPKGAERNPTDADPFGLLGFLNRVPLSRTDVITVPSPLFHALGLAGTLFGLLLGATLRYADRFDPDEVYREFATGTATAGVLVPVMLSRVLDAAEADRQMRGGPRQVDSLRWLLVSGSALPPAVELRARRTFGPVVRNLYGSTEAGWISIASSDDMARHPGTVGRPMPGVQIEIRDADGKALPTGDHGEIVIRSKTVFAGYTEDAGGFSAKHPEPNVLCLGDVGWVDADGFLFVGDRADDMVVTGGENVYPAEVERVLVEMPNIADSAVVGVDDAEYGKVLVAFVVPREGQRVDPDDVRTFVRGRIANYKVPKRVWVMGELPYNATGKVLRRVLRDEAQQRMGTES